MSFKCVECFDTETIDQGGREIACPVCVAVGPTVKITGLAHGLGDEGRNYFTVTAYSSSTITFAGTRGDILADVVAVRRSAEITARSKGLTGRNSVSSGAIAIERRVRKALATSTSN